MTIDPWWESLTDDEAEANTVGVPPYDVEGVARFLAQRLDSEGRILDLGCGTGALAEAFLNECPEADVYGVDSSSRMVARCRARRTQGRFAWCDGDTLPEDTPTIDGAYCVAVFQHLPDKVCRSYVRQVGDRLRMAGRFVFQFVPDTHRGERSYPHSLATAMGWCDDAGLSVEGAPSGPGHGEWRWLVAFTP